MPRGVKLKFAQKSVVSKVGALMQKARLVSPGARIGVAVSGGVDSFVLMQALILRRAIIPFPVELMALHLNPGFDPHSHRPLADWLASQGVASHLELTDFGPRAHSPENRTHSACFFCAMLRRTRLFELCREYRLTHLAFGHNNDDLAVTFFMNLFQGGRVDGLSIKEDYFSGGLTVIRPILFVDKPTIRTAARQWRLPVFANPCPSADSTKRGEIHGWLEERFQVNRKSRESVFSAVRKFQFERTPDVEPTSENVEPTSD